MDNKSLNAAAVKIKDLYKNATIILFGSAARNEDREGSDIDLCLVIDNPQERLKDISINVRREIYPILNRPIDILIYSRETFDDRASSPYTIEAEIMEEGIVL